MGFVYFSAPDLALTQISVEVVTIILLLLALNFLPRETPKESSSARRLRDAGIAVIGGVAVTGLTYAILVRDFAQESISAFHLANSYKGGGGTNVVNVILVDFRGFDTYGEIIVLGIAALVIYALTETVLKGPGGRWLASGNAGIKSGGEEAGDRHPMMMVVATRVMMPIALMVGAFIFLRGHNEPGGGFIAGLIVAIAFLMQYMASGFAWAEARQRITYHATIGIGVLIASLTGIGSWLAGRPFLTSDFGYLHFPPIEEFEWATAIAFDIGVFLTVVGAVMLALNSLSSMARSSGETVNVHAMDINPARGDTPSEGKT
jgi:multicomponent K+:H+ antiporter subunit A